MILILDRPGNFTAASVGRCLLAAATVFAWLWLTSITAMSDGRSGLRIGGSVGVAPKYEGSDEYRVIGFPLIIPISGNDGVGGVFRRYISFQGLDDVRIRLLQYSNFEAGPLFGYAFGRDQDDGDRLAGLGDVDGGVIVGGFARVKWQIYFLDASYHNKVTGDDSGGQVRISAGFQSMVGQGIRVHGRIGASIADDDYMDSYFSVTPLQAARSVAGLAQYDADSGFKDAFAEIGARVELSPTWAISPTIRYSHLLGDAADSPVVETEHQFSGRLGITYSWHR